MFSLLYIDDEPGLLEIGQLFLERTGEFTVTTALSADAGLACLAQRDFDAVISDYQMPGMDGISLLKNVRKSYGNIPFVLFTGRGREEIVIEAINNGVDFYLQKGGDPKVQFAELAHKVRQAVNRRRAETALSDSEKRLADIINFLPDATFAIDMQGIVIAWNRAMEQMTGVSSAEILGKGNFEYAIPFYRERRPMLLNLVLSDNQNIAEKYPFVKREGKTLFSEITTYHFRGDTRATLWFTASPLYNWKGELTGSIESIRDITERKQAEENLVSANREYTNLLDQIQDVYYRSDTEGRLVKASRSWATLFGYDDISECLGKNIADEFYVNPPDRKRLLEEIYRNGKVSGYELLLKKKDGTPVLVEASSHLYHDPAGTIIGVEGTFRDITARKKAEEELRAAYSQITANEEKFRSIVETSPDIIWELDLQGKLRYVSPRIEAVMGYLPEEIIGRSIIDLVSEEVKPFILQELPRYASSTKPPLPLEIPARHRDGHELFLEIRPAPAGADGNVTGFRGVAVDITERKRAEKALKTSEKRFRELAELLPQGIYEADANGTLTYANPRALEMFRHTEEDIKKGLNIRSTIAHKDRQRVETAFGQIAERRIQPMESTEYLALRKDGTTFPIAIFSSPITREGRVTGVRGILIDITERKTAEDALSESERRFRELADLLPQGIYEADITGRLTYANRIAQEMSGYTPEDLRKGLNAMTVFAPEDRQRAAAVFSQMVEQGIRSEENTEYKAQRKDGTTFPVSIFSSPVIRDGRIVGVRGIIIDITERKRAEEELRAVNEQLVASEEELRAQYNELAESEKRIRMSETRLTFMLGFYEYSQKSEKELLEYAIEGAGIVTGSPLGYLAFLNEDESQLSMYAWSKTAMAECSMREKPIIYKTEKTGLWGEAVRQRQPVITNDYAAPNPAKKGYPEGHPRIIRHMNVPVLDEGHIVLVAGVANKPSDYTEKDASELLLLVQGLWTIIKRKQLQEEQKAAFEQISASEEELREQYEELAVTQDDLQRHKLQLEEIAGTLPGVIYQFYARTDGSMGFYYISRRAAEVFGISSNPEDFFERFTQHVDPRDREAFLQSNRNVTREGLPWHYEGRFIKPSGDEIWFEGISRPIRRDNELVFNGVLLDITARKQAEEALRARSEEYQKILQTAMDGFCIVAMDGSFIDVNDAFCKSVGYTREEVLTLSLPHIEVRENPDETAHYMKDIISKGRDRFETRFRQKDGGIIDVEVSVVYTEIHGGRFITFSRDITRRKKEIEELRLLKISADRSSDEVFWLDFTGQILYVNDAACRATGYSREEFAAMKIFELDPDFSPEVWEASVADLRKRKTQFITTRHKRKDGSIMDVEIVAVYVNQDEREYSFAYVRDISGRIRAENQVRESEQNYRLLFETATEGILIAQGDRMVKVNHAMVHLLGYPEDVITSQPFTDFIHPDDRELVMSRHLQRMRGEVPPTGYVFRVIARDNQEKWVIINSTSMEWSKKPASLSFLTDITEQKVAEERLVTANKEYTNLLDQIQDVYYRTDTAGRLVKASHSFATLLGYDDIAECLGRNIAEDFYMNPGDRSRLLEEINRKGKVTDYEVYLRKKDGTPVLISTNSHVNTDATGRIIGIEGTFRDITERKRTETTIFESERKYRTLFETADEGIWTVDAEFRTTSANRKMQQIFGYTEQEMMGRPVWDFVPPEDAESVKQELFKRPKGIPGRYERCWVKNDGAIVWCFTSATPLFSADGTFAGSFGMFTDITERRQMEESLRESEEKFRAVINQSFEFIGLMSTDGMLIVANRSALEFAGIVESDVINRPFWETPWWGHSDELRERLKDAVRRAAAGETVRFEATHPGSDGHIATIDFSVKPVVDPTGKILYLIPEGRDITERKRAEEALRESEEKYRMLVDHSRDGVFIVQDGRLVFYNRALSGLSGYSPEELDGRPLADLIAPEDKDLVVSRAKDRAMGKKVPERYEFTLLHKDGPRRIRIRVTAGRGTYKGRPASIGTFFDVTEDRRREEALHESEEKYRMLVESSFDGIAIHQDGILVYVNRTAARLLGSDDPDVFIGRPAIDLVAPAYRERIMERIREAPESSQQLLHEQFQRLDGTAIDVDVTSTPGMWKGRPAAFVTFRDITEQKRAEVALRESESRWRQWIEQSPIPIGLYRLDGTGIYSNVHFVRTIGYTLDEIPDMETYWRTVFPDPQYRKEKKMAWEDRVKSSVVRGGYIEPLEAWISCRDGVTRTLEFTGLVIGDTILVTYYDLTTREKSQEALHESEEKYRTLVEVNRDIIYSLDTDGTILYTSPQITAQLGYKPDEVEGHNFTEIVHPDDIGSLVRHIQENFITGKPVAQDQFRLRRKDGTYRWYEDKTIYETDRRGRHIISGTIRDITEEKTALDALRESEEKFRTILDTTSEWIWDLDLHGCHTYSNPAVESLLGYTKDEILGINTFEMIHPDDRDRIKQIFASSVNKKSGWRNVRLRWQHKDGTYRFLESNATAIFNERGELTGFRGADRDITESVHAEDALRESEEKFRALVETTSDFIWEVDATGVYSYVSPQVCQILGYEPEDLIGRTPFDFMPPDEVERISSEFNRCVTSQLPIVALENKAFRKDGSVVVLETSGVVRTANDGRYLGYRGIDRDITTRKEAAERTTRLSALKQDLLRTAPLEEKLRQITDGIVEIFGADFARIWMTGPGDLCDKGCIHAAVTKGPHICRNRKSCLHLIASSGRYTHTDGDHRRVPFGAYKIGRLATSEEAHFITNDVTRDPRVQDHAWAESLGLVSFSGFQLVSPGGEPIGVLAFFSREPITQDIVDDLDDMATTTSQVIQMGMAEEAQREREEWARTILNTAQTGIVLIDAETHQILDANPKALGMIGLPRDSVIGRICHYFICPAEKGNCPVTDGGQVVDTSERILVTASDTMVPVLKTVISVSLGGKKVLVESFVDISEQKRSEAAIRESNRKLNLLSSITRHDVANQLTVIQGYTQLAALSNPEPVIADFLAKIESGIDTIQRQIEFTRTYQDLGVQAPSWFRIGDVVRSVRHEGVKLVCTCKSYEIYADPMIGRVFFNLFDNAVRYGERVTTVRVGCAKKGKKLVIRFADNGVGIPPIEKKKIFQKGYGKHTGFGLFLAREILAITGITIQETGTYGEGAVFEITVPESSFRKAD